MGILSLAGFKLVFMSCDCRCQCMFVPLPTGVDEDNFLYLFVLLSREEREDLDDGSVGMDPGVTG